MDPATSDNDRPDPDRPDPDRPDPDRPDPDRPDPDRPDPDRPDGGRPDPDGTGGDPFAYAPAPVDPYHSGASAAGPPGSRQRGRALAGGGVGVLVVTLLGVPLGLLWSALAPDVPVIKTTDGAVLTQPQPEEFIAADGWFSLLALAFGVLVALAVWWVRPRWRGPGGMLVAVTGALGAALVAWGLGRQIGLGGYREQLAAAPVGQTLAKPPDLRAGGFEWVFDIIPTVQGDVLLGAFGAAVAYTLLAGWSSHPDLLPARTADLFPAEAEHLPARWVDDPAAGAGTLAPERTGTTAAEPASGGEPPADQVSSGSPETRDSQASPAPPGPGEAGPARG